MGRNIKEGLSFYPMDVDFFEDEKIQFVSARFGLKGEAIAVRILCRIYRQGYFMEFNEDVSLLFARSVGDINSHGLVRDVVNELLKRDFFDKVIFERFGILTSKGIQKRYLKICKDAKRVDCKIIPDFDTINVKNGFTPEEMEIIPEEMEIIPEFSTQRKEKKRKEEKIKKSTDVDKKNTFDFFWIRYHEVTGKEKTDKVAAEKHWNRLKELEKAKAIENIPAYWDYVLSQKNRDGRTFCKKARTYLADKNFNDDYGVTGIKTGVGEWVENGKRFYGSRESPLPVPDGAPPRPDDKCYFDVERGCWSYG